jgi:hypothetical protein
MAEYRPSLPCFQGSFAPIGRHDLIHSAGGAWTFDLSPVLILRSINQTPGLGRAEWREDKKCLGGLVPEGRGSVPEGRSDRSLARSAWTAPSQRAVP